MQSADSSIDYQRIASAIGFLREQRAAQPSLCQLADHMSLSEAHLQRLFTRWVGISPKRFMQFLSIEYAKQCMARSHDLLDLALQTGLSGGGRLHDLFVTMEAMSPGEYRNEARGLVIRYGQIQTPFGAALLGFSERGICHMSFMDNASPELEALRTQWPEAQLCLDQAAAGQLGAKIFAKERPGRPLSAWVIGSNFQIQVWRAMLRLPPGHLLSYGQLAEQLGRPRAARSVGTAVAQNPIAYLIPCHRVIRASGEFGSYHWGEDRKAAMVGWEAALNAQRPQS